MAAKPSVAMVGAGRLGTSLATALSSAGYPVVEIVVRKGSRSRLKALELTRKIGARLVVGPTAIQSDLLWLCVPDREIAGVAREIAVQKIWNGTVAFHSSGALASDELRDLRKHGASVAAVHPLMTFVAGSNPALQGVPFGLEGDAPALKMARAVIRDLGGSAFLLSKEHKPAYHAWGAFLSPLLVALLVAAESAADVAGLSPSTARKMMMPIIRQTLANYIELGPASAFTGPLVRGDEKVVSKHLKVLKKSPEARAVYIALARFALRELPVERRKRLKEALSE